MRFLRCPSPALVLPLLLATPLPLSAQVVRGALTEDGSGAPLPGAVVMLLDSGGRQLTGDFTDESGRFAMQAPGPGRYTLRVQRIGYRSTVSPPVNLVAGQTVEQRLVASVVPVKLSAIRVTGKSRCLVRPQDGLAAATLWEEARKALTATKLAQHERRLPVSVTRYERLLEPNSLQVESEHSWTRRTMSQNPFVSIPAEELAKHGYIRVTEDSTTFYAPDARVLLSDSFLDHHCFRVEPGGRENAGLLGLAFEPVKERKLPDVQGVLWLDQKSSELRFLEYRYTRVPYDVPTEHLGGRVEFQRLPSGAWIVRQWAIRMPIVAMVENQSRRVGDLRSMDRTRAELSAIREEGGETRASARAAAPTLATARTTRPQPARGDSAAPPVDSASLRVASARAEASAAKPDDAPANQARVSLVGRKRVDRLTVRSVPATAVNSAGAFPRAGFAHVVVAVTDSAGVPLASAQVLMGGAEGWRTASDRGLVQLRDVPAGRRRVEVRAVGYQPDRVEIVVGDRTVTSAAVALSVKYTRLAEQRVKARPDAATAGFQRRRKRGMGHFISRAEIKKRGAQRVSDVLRGVPGVRLVPVNGLTGMEYRIQMTRTAPRVVLRSIGGGAGGQGSASGGSDQVPQLGGASDSTLSASDFQNCPVMFYLDGYPLYSEVSSSMDGQITPGEIESIEIYQPGQAPAQFAGRYSRCGVIVIWTRRSADERESAEEGDEDEENDSAHEKDSDDRGEDGAKRDESAP